MHINELPIELLVRIFSFLDDFTERLKLERICKHWTLIAREHVWKTKCHFSKPLLKSNGIVPLANRCGEWLQELSLEHVKIDIPLIDTIARMLPQLRHLNFRFCEVGYDAMRILTVDDAPLSPWKTAIQRNFMKKCSQSVINFGCNLRTLVLFETTSSNGYHRELNNLFQKDLCKLEHIGISIPHDFDSGTTPPRSFPATLRSIRTDSWSEFGCYLRCVLMSAARSCPELKFLHLEINFLDCKFFHLIGQMPSLIYLRLDIFNIDTSDFRKSFASNSGMMNKLKALSLGCCDQEILEMITEHCSNLVHLSLSLPSPIAIRLSALQLQHLRSLVLKMSATFCFDFNEVLDVANASSQIEHLDIRTIAVPAEIVYEFIQKQEKLNTLHMANNKKLFNAFINPIGPFIKKHKRRLFIWLHTERRAAKIVLPDDLTLLEAGWEPLKVVIKEKNAVLEDLYEQNIGENAPSFLADYWTKS